MRDKVCEALRNCLDNPRCRNCPWEECEGEQESRNFPVGLIESALSLLSVGVEPKHDEYGTAHYCGECGTRIFFQQKYCCECGRKVNWSDRK